MTKNKIQIDQFLQSIEKTKRICDIQSKFQMQNSSLIAYNEVFYSLNTTMSIITESASKTCLNNISSLNISAHFDPLIQQEVLRRTTEIISSQQKIEEELERNNLLLEQLIEHTSD